MQYIFSEIAKAILGGAYVVVFLGGCYVLGSYIHMLLSI